MQDREEKFIFSAAVAELFPAGTVFKIGRFSISKIRQ